MNVTFRRYDPERDEEVLVDLLTTESWPQRLKPSMTEADARDEIDRGAYSDEAVLTFLIEADGEVVGLVRAEGLGDDREDPQLDFRVRERVRGQGVGLAALRHITDAVFTEYPATFRIEGQTREDNIAMRKVFVRGGYVKEAVYRQAWPVGAPGASRRMLDGIGYAILRSDWESGTITPVDWFEPD